MALKSSKVLSRRIKGVVALFLTALMAGSAVAQNAPVTSGAGSASPSAAGAAQNGQGGCFVAPAALTPDDVNGFLGSPERLLSDFPGGGITMANRVRSLAGTSPLSLAVLISLLSSSNAAQVAAIGAGLARAASACASVDPVYAAQIQQIVAEANNAAFETAFMSANNETQTAALGGAGGGEGGAGGIGGGGTPGGSINGPSGSGDGVTQEGATFGGSTSGTRYFGARTAGGSITNQISITTQ